MKITPPMVRDAVEPLLGDRPRPAAWAERLAQYLDLLVERNAQVNLVSRRSVDDLVAGQLVPSLAALAVVPPVLHAGATTESGRVLDVGSGGGFPALPLAVLRPDLEIHLVEATRKKCDFLETVRRELSLGRVRVHWARVEARPADVRSRAPYDVALARAVGAPEVLAEAVRPLLRPDGALWTFVAPDTAGAEHPWPPLRPATALQRWAMTAR